MNLFDAARNMCTLVNPKKDTVWEQLEAGYYIIAGDNNKYGYSMLKLVLFYNDGILWIGKLSDSTPTKIIITLMMAARLKGTLYDEMWDC